MNSIRSTGQNIPIAADNRFDCSVSLDLKLSSTNSPEFKRQDVPLPGRITDAGDIDFKSGSLIHSNQSLLSLNECQLEFFPTKSILALESDVSFGSSEQFGPHKLSVRELVYGRTMPSQVRSGTANQKDFGDSLAIRSVAEKAHQVDRLRLRRLFVETEIYGAKDSDTLVRDLIHVAVGVFCALILVAGLINL